MNEVTGSVGLGRRMVKYAATTGCVQGLLGLGVLSTMFGRGPLVLLFLVPMTNVAYPWLMQNAIGIRLWPFAIAIGTVFMFLAVFAIGECLYRLRKLFLGSAR